MVTCREQLLSGVLRLLVDAPDGSVREAVTNQYNERWRNSNDVSCCSLTSYVLRSPEGLASQLGQAVVDYIYELREFVISYLTGSNAAVR